MLGSLSAGKTINPQLLASLQAAATETEVAAAKIDVAVKGSVAAMDSVVSTVINTVKSTSGSGKLAAAVSGGDGKLNGRRRRARAPQVQRRLRV